MNIIVFDLEATCWEGATPNRSEIIEIGAVKFNPAGEKLDEFDVLIRPQIHPELSAFCTELTTITQAMLEDAPSYPEAERAFRQWIGEGPSPYLLLSWGAYDRKQLHSDAELHQLDSAWIDHHLNLKTAHCKLRNLKRPMGMKRALALEGLDLLGTHHRGIDDARNIGSIFQKYVAEWPFLRELS
ncbi:3'-5' exonuclease [Pontibacter sp. G13]|uniref:3'-5' exonuclease n=1 Tax=Pontibacter sp. G13 TaxID=3074898 RepID=UPI00288BBFDC|nr:3'-5' exonuclease [Pontibacter sp. G13]WNJ20207.1 3'-5' exonuclease [Pontibacter sp. G13]